MGAHLLDWAVLLARWFHIVAGIAWIGASFYFIWVENALQRAGPQRDAAISGHLWAVHGGGFYYLEKYKTAPATLPPTLHWFKWEAYATWLSGVVLLTLVYYVNAQAWLLPPGSAFAPWQGVMLSAGAMVAALFAYLILCATPLLHRPALLAAAGLLLLLAAAGILRELFTARAAYIHIGAMIGTIMVANVLLVIIPGQQRLVELVGTSERPDPALVRRGVLRSTHNNYLTLPVIVLMISAHHPAIYTGSLWLLVLAALIAGSAAIRHFFNLKNRSQWHWRWAAAGVVLLLAAGMLSAPETIDAPDTGEVSFAQVQTVIDKHCVSCHAQRPTDPVFKVAPLGFRLDSPELIESGIEAIYQRTVVDKSMPFNNTTEMTAAERGLLNSWYEQQASDSDKLVGS